MSVAVDKFRYRLPYKMLFGGASAIRSDQFRCEQQMIIEKPVLIRELNGYSNMFWGWGAEDDDMSKRMSTQYFIVENLCVVSHIISIISSCPSPFNITTILPGIKHHKFKITRYKANIARLLITNLCYSHS